MRLPLLTLLAAAVMSVAPGARATDRATLDTRNIVLLHGAGAGNGWQRVHDVLEKDGYHVTVVETPAVSLSEDVAITRRAIARQDGPVVLVGHSGDGAVVTEAGSDPKVVGLVYVAALVPDVGESAQPAGRSGALPGSRPDTGTITSAAWKTKPSLYLVASGDQALPERAQRAMAKRAGSVIVAVSGNQPIYVSTPVTVAKIIEQGAHVDQEAAVRAKALAMAGVD